MPADLIAKFEKEYPGRGKEVYYATMNKNKRNPETGKKKTNKKEDKMEDTSILANTDILTEQQKEALKGIIDQIVEERAKAQNKAFIGQYTEFIVEQATKKLTNQMMQKFIFRCGVVDTVKKDTDATNSLKKTHCLKTENF